MGDVSVSLLGGFSAEVDGVAVPATAWRLKKARELVKLLALAPGHRLHREQAMDVLWRDLGPAAAANNLHQAVHVARRTLDADAIELRDEVLTLTADIDVDRFELAAADARRLETPAAYRAAVALYTGELLPENRYDDWAETRREELATLAAELEEESAALGSARPFGLPADASSFIGRAQELAELTSLLRRTRLLTLSGTGGAGKTRLALELARSAEPSYEAGAALVELAALADARLIPEAVAAALDIRALPAQDVVEAVIDVLSARTLLLVLDNCEHVLAATAALSDRLLRFAPELTIVATSREPLRVAGEVVFRVPSLDIPSPDRPLPLEELLEYESVSLFVDRAAAASPGFELDAENAEDVARICFRLDGLPLALELAAGRVGVLSPAAIAERLDDRFRLLRSGSHAAPTRQQTLTATLQWSHDLLEPDEQVLFRRLAIFAGGFELEAVEEVCAGDGLEAAEVADVLARLAEKSLVAVEEGRRERRYRLLETVRMYARERLAEAAEAPTLALRHAGWALALAEREQGSAQLDRETPNLRAALDTLLAHAPHDALRLCVALLPFWLRRIELDEARRRFAVALEACPERTTLGAEALLAAAAIDFRSGTLSAGMPLAERSRAVASEIGDAHREWRALQFLGEFGIAGDAAEVALPWLEQALALARRERFAAGEAISIHSLGVAAWIAGDLPQTDDLIAESIELFRALEESTDTIPSPLNIAEIRLSQPEEPTGPEASLRGHVAAVRRDLLRRGGKLRAGEPGGDRPRPRRSRESVGAAGRERSPVRGRRGQRRHLDGARPPRLHVPRRAGRRCSARAPRTGPRAAGRAGRQARARARPFRARPGRDDRGRLRPRRAPPRRGSRHLPAGRRPLGPRQHALAHRRPGDRARQARRCREPRCARRFRCWARRSANAGSRARSQDLPRSPCSAATPSRRPSSCATRASATRRGTTRSASRRSTSGFGALLRSR